MADRSSEIIVGIDFGTTHSGVSWAVNGGTRKIRLINNWPDPLALASSPPKVPSSISYANGKPQRWGYQVDVKDESFKWIKILLESHNKYIETVQPVKDSNALLGRIGKTAQDVVADYLKYIWEYTMNDIRNTRDDYDESTFSIRVILTVPAMWSPAAKDKTLQAARKAGLPKEITLVTEPEAAALATLKERSDDHMLRVDDAFVVCDAGGGTVDLISYKVLGLSPLSVEECAVGEGDLCGSVFLDMAFQKLIVTLIGEYQWNKTREVHKKRVMKQFEYGIKRCFTEDSNEEFSVELPGVQDDPANNIEDDTITINMSKLRAVFDVVFLKIENLISKQITQVTARNLRVKAILLVGGFGESMYLLERLRRCHSQSGIAVVQVSGAWSSICRGATMWGLEHSEYSEALNKPTVVSRMARYSYGICFSVAFDPSKHSAVDRYFDPQEGHDRARNQMSWLLRKGEEIQEGRVLHERCYNTVQVGFWEGGDRYFQTELFYCEDDNPPSRRTDSVRQLCKVTYGVPASKLWLEDSFRSLYSKGKFRNASFDFFIVLGNAALDFFSVYRGEPVGYVEAQYREHF